jgi:hypothetical protein
MNKELIELKIKWLYLELYLTRCQWIHRAAEDAKEEKDWFGIGLKHELNSIWDYKKISIIEEEGKVEKYDYVTKLEENITFIHDSALLKDLEKDLDFIPIKKTEEIFSEIEKLKSVLKTL